MIVEADTGWWLVMPKQTYGPYVTFEAAARCLEQYQAFVDTAPSCHP